MSSYICEIDALQCLLTRHEGSALWPDSQEYSQEEDISTLEKENGAADLGPSDLNPWNDQARN